MPADRLAGKLLVATPLLRDPNFHRTVVLLLDHGADGALGVVLNRPSDTSVDEPLPQWRVHAAEPAVVFVGGPVAPGSAICLARAGAEEEREGWQPLFDRLGTVDLGRSPVDLGLPIEGMRVFSGYAGWGPSQLEGEIDAGAWFVLDAEPGDALSGDPRSLWRSVLRRQPGVLGAVANFPPELAAN
jgi:putative transcriptional regulator